MHTIFVTSKLNREEHCLRPKYVIVDKFRPGLIKLGSARHSIFVGIRQIK